MIKIYTPALSVPNGTLVPLLIEKVTVPDNQKWNVLEVGASNTAATGVEIFVGQERVCTFVGAVSADGQRRVTNWELPGGTEIRVYAVNTSGAALVLGVEIIADVTAA
jgi:hypothetical protein